ncbi:hypothetical protein SAY87_001136 [Trapa incisa]|uniref:TFIIF beta subunit HTH domain-containing protein n=1 Tax=Trapa incisa TaxID=236973 RepID=A0AAN7GCR6_9MYRT|nr:hypothetical protein SAY87_001136 [Trapa incisa]
MDTDKGSGSGQNSTRNTSGKLGGNANSGGSQAAGAGTVVIGGFVDTGKADRTMWLMKCPPVVSRSLQHVQAPPPPPAIVGLGDDGNGGAEPAPPPSRPVAKVILSFDPLHSSEENSTEFTMELASTESGNIPKRYALEMSKDFVPLSAFSESYQGKIAVEGKILNKFDMRPHNENIENYGKLCRERTNKCMKKGRQIQVIDHDNRNLIRPMPLMMEKKKTPVKVLEMKRTRKARGEMEEIMFKLFERQPNWTLRLLIQETDQPEQFLKDILKDLCVYNNKGAQQGTYELKPEYRSSNDDPP